MEEEVRQLIELPLSKEELILLEKQEKQLKIIQEELKTIQANHERAIIKTKQRLQLKEEAEKVISAIQNKKTNQVTGGDMARLIKGMEADSLFKNRKSVEKAMEERNGLTNELIDKLKALINEHKQRENDLPKPEQIPNKGPDHLQKNQIHGGHCQQRRGSRPKRSCLRQNGDGRKYQPVFAREQLIAGESCEVEIVDYNTESFMIGVATAELRNRADQYNNNNSMCICIQRHTLFRRQITKEQFRTQNRRQSHNSPRIITN
jgi:hypothetical protein